eukprot:2095729-Pleurochrysis_carterae.AAC.2
MEGVSDLKCLTSSRFWRANGQADSPALNIMFANFIRHGIATNLEGKAKIRSSIPYRYLEHDDKVEYQAGAKAKRFASPCSRGAHWLSDKAPPGQGGTCCSYGEAVQRCCVCDI